MGNRKPLLSIVVPTKDRYHYLKYLVSLISRFESRDVELIIQDNSCDNSDFTNYLSSLNHDFIKYYYEKTPLTSIENFDRAILNSNGEYVCFIGDDDGIMRYAVDCVKWMKRNNIEALRSSYTHFYYDKIELNGRSTNQKLVYKIPKILYKYYNPIQELKRLLKNGCELDYIPVLYNGIVKREILIKMYSHLGTFFPGASADISNGVALCFYVKRYVKVEFPIIIGGSSIYTGGGVRLNRNYSIDDVPFMSKLFKQNWEGHIPRLWYGSLVWEESAIKALRAMNKESFILLINHDAVMSNFQSLYKKSVDNIRLVCLQYSTSYGKVQLYRIKRAIRKVCNGLINHVYRIFSRNRSRERRWVFGICNIDDAENYIYTMLCDKIDFNKL